jgi:hypothetical protein
VSFLTRFILSILFVIVAFVTIGGIMLAFTYYTLPACGTLFVLLVAFGLALVSLPEES